MLLWKADCSLRHHRLARRDQNRTVVQHELRRKGVTLLLLWQEYKEREPDGFQYSWFCDCYRAWQPVGLFA